MNKLSTILTLIIVTIFWSFGNQNKEHAPTVNSLIGDISFVSKFGHSPTATDDENLRIKTHLEYVENLLRQKDVSAMPEAQREKRNHLLDILHKYWTAGIFPRNYNHPHKRVRCFIDKDGRICAVGYLIEQTAGRQIAERINSGFKYDKILAMDDQLVDNWIASSGLTKVECAMIQPQYASPPSYHYIPPV